MSGDSEHFKKRRDHSVEYNMMATPDANSTGSQRTSPFAGQVDICGKILRLEIGPDGWMFYRVNYLT